MAASLPCSAQLPTCFAPHAGSFRPPGAAQAPLLFISLALTATVPWLKKPLLVSHSAPTSDRSCACDLLRGQVLLCGHFKLLDSHSVSDLERSKAAVQEAKSFTIKVGLVLQE